MIRGSKSAIEISAPHGYTWILSDTLPKAVLQLAGYLYCSIACFCPKTAILLQYVRAILLKGLCRPCTGARTAVNQLVNVQGFTQSEFDPCYFYKEQDGERVDIALYVDDGYVLG